MKQLYIILILAAAFFVGRFTISAKLPLDGEPGVAPNCLHTNDSFNQYRISLEDGLRYHAPEPLEILPDPQSNIAAPPLGDIRLNHNPLDTSTGCDPGTNRSQQNQANQLKAFFSDCGTNLVFRAF